MPGTASILISPEHVDLSFRVLSSMAKSKETKINQDVLDLALKLSCACLLTTINLGDESFHTDKFVGNITIICLSYQVLCQPHLAPLVMQKEWFLRKLSTVALHARPRVEHQGFFNLYI